MKRTLLMDVKVGESLTIDGGRIVVTVEEKSGRRVKLRFVHDDAKIERVDLARPEPEPVGRARATGAAQARLGIKVAA